MACIIQVYKISNREKPKLLEEETNDPSNS